MADEKKPCGLYMAVPDQSHTYGLQAINDPNAYDALSEAFYTHPQRKRWFRQCDSIYTGHGDKSHLFIEFLGQDLNDDTALKQCEDIASGMGFELKVL